MRHKLSDELETAHVAGAWRSGIVVTDADFAYPRHLMQRRPSLRSGVRVGAGVEQKCRELIVGVRGCEQKYVRRVGRGRSACGCRAAAPGATATSGPTASWGAPAPRQRFIEACPRLKESLSSGDLPFARGKQERCKTTVRTRIHI